MIESGRLHRTTPKFGKSPIEMLRDKSISDGAARQYAYMHWRYGKNKSNFEGRESIAEALGVSKVTVTNRTMELEQADWLVVIRKYNERTKTTRNVYHLFEDQKDCIAWREKFHIEKPKPKAKKTRKTRAGKGGKPTHAEQTKVNSSLPPKVNSSLHREVNSSLPNLDSSDPDTSEPTQKQKSIALSAPQKPVFQYDDPIGPPPPPKPADIVDAWYDGMPAAPTTRKYPRNVACAKRILDAGYLPEHVKAFVEARYTETYWQGKHLKLETVENDLPLWWNLNKPPEPIPVQVVPVPQWMLDCGLVVMEDE